MLQPIVFGIDYQTADFELRNRLAFTSQEVEVALRRLKSSMVIKEGLLLSTCNRTELYCITHDIDFAINALCDMHGVCPQAVKKHGYVLSGEHCALHLFRVSSGLESMVLGETEIVAQIKSAMEYATKAGTLASSLAGLFQMALSIEKDVRNYTMINNAAISMGYAVAGYVKEQLPHLLQLYGSGVLFIGAGQMMQQIAPHFNYPGFAKKTVINRTLSNATHLAAKIGADAIGLEHLATVISEYAVIILCCSNNVALLDETVLREDIANKHKKLIIDLSMPLVVDKKLKHYGNLQILTIDDFAKRVDVGIEKRKLAAFQAEKIIFSKLDDYRAWCRKRGLSPLIKKLRDESDTIRRESLAIAEKQLTNGEAPNEVLKQLSVQLTNRLLHNPTVNLCASDEKQQDSLIDLVSYLYGLEAN